MKGRKVSQDAITDRARGACGLQRRCTFSSYISPCTTSGAIQRIDPHIGVMSHRRWRELLRSVMTTREPPADSMQLDALRLRWMMRVGLWEWR